MRGKLQKEPGIFNVIDNFYKTINKKEKPLITTQTTLAIINLLESIWKDIAYQPPVSY